MEEQGMLLNQIDFDTILDEIRKRSDSTSEKGTLFEDLCVQVLKVAPIFNDIKHVRKWSEFPGNGGYHDSGIDIVAQKEDGEFYAYQCKFYKDGEKITRDDVNKFITQAQIPFTIDGKKYNFNKDLVVLTSVDEFSENVKQLADVVRIFGHDDFVSCGIDWSEVDLDKIEEIKRVGKKVLKSHQVDAVNALIKGFVNDNDERGRLTMACGTGKTFTSLKFLEEYKRLKEKNVVNVLYLVPSIALLSQTIFEWNNNLSDEYKACNFGICSDSTAGREKGRRKTDDENIIKMPIKSTTNVEDIYEAYEKERAKIGFNFFFSTYQSIDVVHDFQKKSGLKFDFTICDEAHRTIGKKKIGTDVEEETVFTRIHRDDYIDSEKRLYMTATEKIYVENAKDKAKANGYEVYSMDDETIFGKRFYLLTFGEAISRGLLMDYRVMVLTIDKHELASIKLPNLSLEFSAKILGSLRGMSKISNLDNPDEFKADPKQMQRIVAFTSTIDDADDAAKAYDSLKNKSVLGEEKLLENGYIIPSAKVVKGTFSSQEKNKALKRLKSNDIKSHECRILTNARCLSEGVDVPALDGVVFLAQKKSQVDIIQAVGRVMRKFGAGEDKKFGYIIIPVIVDSEKDVAQALSNSPDYKIVWQVIQALRSHDERLDNNINAAKLTGKLPANIILLHNFNVSDNSSKIEGKDTDDVEEPRKKGKVQIELINVFIPELVKHCGNRLYWEDWSEDIGNVTNNIAIKIKNQIENNEQTKKAFDKFLKGLRAIINPYISEENAISMLSSHIVVIPVLKAIFGTAELIDLNEISKIMNKMVNKINNVEGEIENLESFYEDVRKQVETIKDGKGRQELIRTLFEKFFQFAMPDDAEKFGIVYTPIEIVDFIINSVNDALKDNFNKTLADKGIKILDPFTGTGTFIIRLLEKIYDVNNDKDNLKEKYLNDIWCNEIMLLAYYIALINIEDTYSRLGDDYIPFNHALLTDTFQLSEGRVSGSEQQKFELEEFATATKLMKEEDEQDIKIIIGNPPYSAKQKNASKNNANISYKILDEKIQMRYSSGLDVTNKAGLHDSYVRAFRWATDRIGNFGIVAFVTNGTFINNLSFRQFRKNLLDEFNKVYVINLKGNFRKYDKKEGENVFGNFCGTTICITLLVKNKETTMDNVVHYYEIEDNLKKRAKLEFLKEIETLRNIDFLKITPDKQNDWINKTNTNFSKLIPLGSKKNDFLEESLFGNFYSSGIKTAKDAWLYSFNRDSLNTIMLNYVNTFNCLVDELALKKCDFNANDIKNKKKFVFNYILENSNPKIKITEEQAILASRGEKINSNNSIVVKCLFRPFTKKYCYFNKSLIQRIYKMSFLFNKDNQKNYLICISGIGGERDFSCLAADTMTDVNLLPSGSQCFPLYWYKGEEGEISLFDNSLERNNDAISNWSLNTFRNKYRDNNINKEDIFYYVYALFHSKTYKEKYVNNLMKESPRIPFLKYFWAYSNIGRKLADLHLNYENVNPYRCVNIINEDGNKDYTVKKIRFLAKDRKDTIIFNDHFKIENIPLEVYDYVVNGRSPIEWVMDQYQYSEDKESGIIDDPNKFEEAKGGKYVFDLILSLITVSLETLKLIDELPPYEEIE